MKVIPYFRSFRHRPQGPNSSSAETRRLSSPKLGRKEFIEMDSYNYTAGFDSSAVHGHHFCPIPLDSDTFCDSCACPIYSLGSGPVCLRCADCHITCHRRCVRTVRIVCAGSGSPAGHSASFIDSTVRVLPEVHGGISDSIDTELTAEVSSLSLSTEEPETDAPPVNHYNEASSTNNLAKSSFISDVHASSEISFPPNDYHSVTGSEVVGNNSELDGFIISDKMETLFHTTVTSVKGQLLNTTSDSCTTSRLTQNSNLLHNKQQIAQSQHFPVLRKSRNGVSNAMVARHSFLCGRGADAAMYSRLSYDFSSLDRENIEIHGIKVRKVSVAALEQSEISSSSDVGWCGSEEPLLDSSCSSLSVTNSELGFSSVMQTTAAFVKAKSRRHRLNSGFVPAPNLSLTPTVVIGPRGRLPYNVEQLIERLAVFNVNEFGLQSRTATSLPPGDCEGQIRIHINLLRPIRMLLTVRPLSIFDLVVKEGDDESDADDENHPVECLLPSGNSLLNGTPVPQSLIRGIHQAQPKSAVTAEAPTFSADYSVPRPMVQRRLSKKLFGRHPQTSTFWLPRGSTKLLYIRISTTTRQVITMLLDRFQIADNPQKFALYEHTIEGEHEVSVRKLFDDESPLGLVLRWTEDGPEQFNQLLGIKRLVLQENETGDIEWSGFSLPELHTFLSILNQEEMDYRRRIELRYDGKRKEVRRLLAQHEQAMQTSLLYEEEDKVTQSNGDGLTQWKSDLSIPSSFTIALHETTSPQTSDTVDEFRTVSANISPVHSPERKANNTSATLPGFLSMDKTVKSTLFKPSPFKQMKKVAKAREKLAIKLEKERVRTETKRLKAEAKLSQQNKPEARPSYPRRFFRFGVRPNLSSTSHIADSQPATKH